jgi:protein-arginine kinase activator protein McsA
MDKVRGNFSIEQFTRNNESEIIRKVNDSEVYCKCGTNAEMFLSTGFPTCSKCEEMFSKLETILKSSFIKETKVEIIENSGSPVYDIEPEEELKKTKAEIIEIKEEIKPPTKLEENIAKLKELSKKMEKYIKEEKFAECAVIRDEINAINKENETLFEK